MTRTGSSGTPGGVDCNSPPHSPGTYRVPQATSEEQSRSQWPAKGVISGCPVKSLPDWALTGP
jgi:hypothetical protein